MVIEATADGSRCSHISSSAGLERKNLVPFQTHGGWPGHVLEDITTACEGAEVTCDMQVKFDSTGGDHLETKKTEIEAWAQKVNALY